MDLRELNATRFGFYEIRQRLNKQYQYCSQIRTKTTQNVAQCLRGGRGHPNPHECLRMFPLTPEPYQVGDTPLHKIMFFCFGNIEPKNPSTRSSVLTFRLLYQASSAIREYFEHEKIRFTGRGVSPTWYGSGVRENTRKHS